MDGGKLGEGLRSLGGSGFLPNLGRGLRAESGWAICGKISKFQAWTGARAGPLLHTLPKKEGQGGNTNKGKRKFICMDGLVPISEFRSWRLAAYTPRNPSNLSFRVPSS